MPAPRKRPLDEEEPSKRKPTAKTWGYPARNNPLPTFSPSQKTKIRAQAAKDTLKKAKEIVDCHESRFGFYDKFTHTKTRRLGDGKRKRPICPNFPTTQVKVINRDTLDAALAIDTASDIMGFKRRQRVLVLNFANAYQPGGGWLNGASAQEEQICFRTTLGYFGLPREFYPMKFDEGIYVNNVALMRENEEKGFSWMWLDKPGLLPALSVISVAATHGPALDATQTKYKNESERTLMEEKMRCILRVAGGNLHTKLVLGALGCGVFRHLPGEVADCWAKVLVEEEFKGWFEIIVFAVLDKKDGANFTTFKKTLHDLDM